MSKKNPWDGCGRKERRKLEKEERRQEGQKELLRKKTSKREVMGDIDRIMADIRESAERLITQEMAALMTLVDLGMPMKDVMKMINDAVYQVEVTAHKCFEPNLRLMKEGKSSDEIAEILERRHKDDEI